MFNGMRAFDWHRVGAFKMHGHTRRCLSVAEMQTKGMVRTAAGIWTTGREFAGIDKVSA
jgi:hypothetical protein